MWGPVKLLTLKRGSHTWKGSDWYCADFRLGLTLKPGGGCSSEKLLPIYNEHAMSRNGVYVSGRKDQQRACATLLLTTSCLADTIRLFRSPAAKVSWQVFSGHSAAYRPAYPAQKTPRGVLTVQDCSFITTIQGGGDSRTPSFKILISTHPFKPQW